MSGHAFRPSVARVQNAQKIFTSTKTNATIRDLEEEEKELEEKEGKVISIERDKINGVGWTVQDADGNIYTCSCASSMYEVPETVERGGILYPTEDVTVLFTINPVLRLSTIKEIKSLGEETEKVDISRWTHEDGSTTVIAKPKSALSISNGFIKLDYNNDNKVLASKDGVETEGESTNINTKSFKINTDDIEIQGTKLDDIIAENVKKISNEHKQYKINSPQGSSIVVDTVNNVTQVDVNASNFVGYGVVGQIKDQKSIPIKEMSQMLITDGVNVDMITIDENGVIRICPFEKDDVNCVITEDKVGYTRNIQSLSTWITPQIEARNYIKVTVKEKCDNCDRWGNTKSEFINYCPSCGNWGCLTDTSTSRIKCMRCSTEYCEQCGIGIVKTNIRLKNYQDNYVIGYGSTCKHCKGELQSDTNKYYVNYCTTCNTWGTLVGEEYDNDGMINVLRCTNCEDHFCCTCGTSQEHYGLTLTDSPVQYIDYKNALRKLKYIKG